MGARLDRFNAGNFAQTLKKGMPLISGLAGGIGGSMLGGPLGGWTGAKAGATLGLMAGGAGQKMIGPSGGGTGGNNAEKSKMMEALSGVPGSIDKIPRFRPNQEQYMDQAAEIGMKGIQNPYEGFEPIAQYARKNFQENTIPEIMHQFIASGSNAPTSPGPWNQQGRAAEGMESNLAALKAQYGMQNRNQMMQMLNMGLAPRDAMFEHQAESGALDEIIPGLSRWISENGITGVADWLKKLFSGATSDVQQDLAESAGDSGVPSFQPMNSFSDVMSNSIKNYRRSV